MRIVLMRQSKQAVLRASSAEICKFANDSGCPARAPDFGCEKRWSDNNLAPLLPARHGRRETDNVPRERCSFHPPLEGEGRECNERDGVTKVRACAKDFTPPPPAPPPA